MKKFIFLSIVLTAVLTCFTSVSAAGSQVSELQDVKVIIEGELGKYNNVPIELNDRTLLPLREILTNLGVENDNEHIIWNGKESSVTIVKDSKKIYLKIGSDKATVNGEEIVLDTKPVLYKDKTYIPVRFVAQSLGKKVIWDGSSKSVLIRDEADFNRIQDIIKKSNAAMAENNNCQMKMDISAETKQSGLSMDIGITAAGKVDFANKDMYMNMQMKMLGMDMNLETYYVDNVAYTSNPLSQEWTKEELTKDEYEKLFDQNSNTNIFDATDALSAGLQEVQSENPDEILLKGDVFLGDLLKLAGQEQGTDISGYTFEKFNVEISLDKNTYLINKLVMETTYYPEDDSLGEINMNISVEYSDYNSNIQIVVPQEVLEKAVVPSDYNFDDSDVINDYLD